MCKSRTRDRAILSALIDDRVHFCDSRGPRQRGANENTNRLLRRTDLAAF